MTLFQKTEAKQQQQQQPQQNKNKTKKHNWAHKLRETQQCRAPVKGHSGPHTGTCFADGVPDSLFQNGNHCRKLKRSQV